MTESPQDDYTPKQGVTNDLGCHVKDTFTQVKSSFEFLKYMMSKYFEQKYKRMTDISRQIKIELLELDWNGKSPKN